MPDQSLKNQHHYTTTKVLTGYKKRRYNATELPSYLLQETSKVNRQRST